MATETPTPDAVIPMRMPTLTQQLEPFPEAFTVQTDRHAEMVAAVQDTAADLEREIVAFFEGTDEDPGPKVLAHQAHAKLCAQERELLALPRLVKKQADKLLTDYRLECEARAREEEQRNAELAMMEQAEERRAEAEQQERLAALTGDDTLRVEAEALRTQPIDRPVTMPVKAYLPAGRRAVTEYKATCVDRMTLLRAIVEGKIGEAAVKVDDAWLSKQATMHEGKWTCPGVRIERVDRTQRTGRR